MSRALAKYLVNQSGLATWYGPWVNAEQYKQYGFTISWTAVASTDGTLSFQGTDDPAQAVAGAGGTNVVTLTVSAPAGGTFPTVGAAAANCMVRFENPSHFIRVIYTRVAGGGANQFQAFTHGRRV